LLTVVRPVRRSGRVAGFVNPRDGWVLVRSTAATRAGGQVDLSVERLTGPVGDEPAQRGVRAAARSLQVTHAKEAPQVLETMRFLQAGEYRVGVRLQGPATLTALAVCAVPELIFCKFQYNPHVQPHGPYDWDFLQRHVLPNVNCIVGSGAPEHEPMVQRWKQQGKRWIIECGVPGLDSPEPLTADEAYAYWARNPGFQDPLLDGVIADEFLGDGPRMKYPQWTEAVRRLGTGAAPGGKLFYPYCTAIHRQRAGADFLRVVMQQGYPFAWEQYLSEPATASDARQRLASRLAAEMLRWRQALPGCERHLVVCFGYMSMPATETLNINPQVDYKVWMDMQFNHIATDSAFRDVYGLMEYTCGYADEETVRWASRLYRHYGLEGATNLLSPRYGFGFHLDHLQNPDFADAAHGWTLEPAEDGSAAGRTVKGYSWLQGRYPRTDLGDTFLWTRRSVRAPNRASQVVRSLRPGRLYSLKMVTADYGELQRGKSAEHKHAVSLELRGVEWVSAKCFQYPIPNNYAHGLGAFNAQNKAWMNYHFRVFRSRGFEARLTISDWASATEPGGPAGQELMFNFLELQPYFSEEMESLP